MKTLEQFTAELLPTLMMAGAPEMAARDMIAALWALARAQGMYVALTLTQDASRLAEVEAALAAAHAAVHKAGGAAGLDLQALVDRSAAAGNAPPIQ